MQDITRRSLVFSGAALAVGALATPVQAATGSVYLKIINAGFIFGVSGGEGTLTFGGRTYGLAIGGLSAGLTAGLAGQELVGTAYHLRSARDIQGVYSKVGVNASAPSGRAYVDLANVNGVTLRLQGRQTGFMISVDLSGLTLTLK
jgi:hypothetical protein